MFVSLLFSLPVLLLHVPCLTKQTKQGSIIYHLSYKYLFKFTCIFKIIFINPPLNKFNKIMKLNCLICYFLIALILFGLLQTLFAQQKRCLKVKLPDVCENSCPNPAK
uniref:Uncharacterized protein n=1 Tax=Meloidogyne enterolobii TaxID=390850 RepID=A0A6V7WLN4_MELEN|nr:unnamed protein product [Meloidogyne enterolobii]